MRKCHFLVIVFLLFAMLLVGRTQAETKRDNINTMRGQTIDSPSKTKAGSGKADATDTKRLPASVLDPANIVQLEEVTNEGNFRLIDTGRVSPIVDRQSMIRIRFLRNDLLTARLLQNHSEHTFAEMANSSLYRGLVRERDSLIKAGNNKRGDSLTAKVDSLRRIFLTEMGGYRMSVRATVYPRGRTPYELRVGGGYTEVRKAENANASDSLRESVTSRSFSMSFEGDWLSDNGIRPTVLELPDATIDLAQDSVKSGDVIAVIVTNSFGDIPREAIWHLQVREVGVYLSRIANMVFVKRNINPSDDGSTKANFKPVPTASLLVKYSTRRFGFNFIDPGIGLNAALLDFRDDESVEIGLGPVVTFANNNIQLGLGWDLQLVRHRSLYYFFYLDILDLAKGLEGDRRTKTPAES